MIRRAFGRGLIPALLTAVLSLPVAIAQSEPPAADAALQSYLSANGLLNRGLNDLAAAEYRKFLAEHADHEKAPTARYGLAVCLFRLKDYAGAESELTQLTASKNFSFATEVGLLLGQCQLYTGRSTEAAKTLTAVLTKYGKGDLADDAAALLIEAHYQSNALEEAARCAEQFAAHWPTAPQRERVDFLWGLSLAATDPAAATARLDDYLKSFPKSKYAPQATLALAQNLQRLNQHARAIATFRRAIDALSDTERPDALIGLASSLFATGASAEAGPLLDQALTLAPDGPQSPAAKLLKGRLLLDKGAVADALPLFEQAAKDEALRDDAAYWTAKGLLRSEKFADAAAKLGSAIEDFPKSELLAEMRYDRAVALARANDLDAAIATAKAFLAADAESPLAPEALHLLAVCLHQQKRFDDCLASCREFQQRFPDHNLTSQIVFLAAESDFLAGRMEDALKGFTAFERRFPTDPQASQVNLRIGLALHRLGRAEEAAKRLEKAPADGPTSGSATLALGDIHFQRGEWKEAERRLSEYLAAGDAQPLCDETLLKLGLSQQRQNRFDDAIKTYEQLLTRFEKSPHRLQAKFERGQALLALERWDDARTAFEETLKDDNGGRFAVFARQHLGAIALRQGRGAAAVEQLSAALENQPDGDVAALTLFQRGLARFTTNDYENAGADFERFLQTYPKDPRCAEAQARLAISLSRRERFPDAARAFEALRKFGVDKLDPALRRTVRYETAWGLQKLGKANEASAIFRELLSEPDALGLSSALTVAEMEASAKHYPQAAELLTTLRENAVKLGETAPADVLEAASYRLGICQFELGKHEPAAATLGEFVEKYPQSKLLASASYFCGESLFQLGKLDPAAECFARVIEGFPKDTAVAASLLRLGEASAALQRWAKSEQVFSDYLQRFADQPSAYQARFGVGWARENQGRFDEAIASYREVIAGHQGPTAARAQFQIGECLFAKKQFEEATRELLKVDILYGYAEWSAAALFEAGRCFEQMGKAVEARAQYKTVAEKHADTRWAELASQRLTELAKAGLPG